LIWTLQIGSGSQPTAFRPEKYVGDQFRGGAIAGEGKSSIHNIISRKKDTGMESKAIRSHQGRLRGQSYPEVAAVLEVAAGLIGDPRDASSRCFERFASKEDGAEGSGARFL
jgi:hypothetical protein